MHTLVVPGTAEFFDEEQAVFYELSKVNISVVLSLPQMSFACPMYEFFFCHDRFRETGPRFQKRELQILSELRSLYRRCVCARVTISY